MTANNPRSPTSTTPNAASARRTRWDVSRSIGGTSTHTNAARTTAATTATRPDRRPAASAAKGASRSPGRRPTGSTLDDLLQLDDLELARSETPDGAHDRLRRLHVRDARDAFAEAGEPHGALVVQRLAAEGCVQDELDLVVLDEVHGVGSPLADLEHGFGFDPLVGEVPGRSARGVELEPEVSEGSGDAHTRRLVAVADRQEHAAGGRQPHARGEQRLRVRLPERPADAHHLTRRPHLGTEHDVV